LTSAGHWGFAGSDCIIQCRPRWSNPTSQWRLRLPSNLNVELEPFSPLSVQRWHNRIRCAIGEGRISMKFVAAVMAAALVMVPIVSFAQGAGGAGSGAGGAGSGAGGAGSGAGGAGPGAGSDLSGTGTSGTKGTVQPSRRSGNPSQGQGSGNPSEGGINNNSMPGTGQGGGR
jgi:hypothetical protein